MSLYCYVPLLLSKSHFFYDQIIAWRVECLLLEQALFLRCVGGICDWPIVIIATLRSVTLDRRRAFAAALDNHWIIYAVRTLTNLRVLSSDIVDRVLSVSSTWLKVFRAWPYFSLLKSLTKPVCLLRLIRSNRLIRFLFKTIQTLHHNFLQLSLRCCLKMLPVPFIDRTSLLYELLKARFVYNMLSLYCYSALILHLSVRRIILRI